MESSFVEYQIIVPVAFTTAKTSAWLVTQPSSPFGTAESDQPPPANPHRSSAT
jgi:hypothetical protein